MGNNHTCIYMMNWPLLFTISWSLWDWHNNSCQLYALSRAVAAIHSVQTVKGNRCFISAYGQACYGIGNSFLHSLKIGQSSLEVLKQPHAMRSIKGYYENTSPISLATAIIYACLCPQKLKG